jgi:hypothetical protein
MNFKGNKQVLKGDSIYSFTEKIRGKRMGFFYYEFAEDEWAVNTFYLVHAKVTLFEKFKPNLFRIIKNVKYNYET